MTKLVGNIWRIDYCVMNIVMTALELRLGVNCDCVKMAVSFASLSSGEMREKASVSVN